jgi:hypothetical protein
MLNLKTKALYISLFAILILIILNQNSFVFSQSRLPVCVSPGSLIVWPDMTPNTVPMASTSNGILRNSYIKFGTSAYNAYHSIFDTLYIYSQLYSNGNVITNPDENRANWVIVNRGALYTTGPRNNFNSGGAIGFQDYSTDTTKLYHTIFNIDQSPYKFYDNNGNVSTSSSYGILRFHYGEFNPTNATITSPRLGNIPPGRSRWRGGLLSLTWEGNLGIGTTNPSAKLDVAGDAIIRGTTTASRFCLGNNCITNWPSGGTNYWILSGNSLYATPTNVNVGIGTTSPQAKLHVVDSAIISSGEAASLNIKGRGGQNIYNFAAVNLVDDRPNANRIWHITHRSNANPQDVNKLFFSYYNGNRWSNLLAIDTTGNVGIGTTSPGAKLHVVGNVRADQFCLGNNCITNWPSGGTNYWILSGNSLYATPTNVNIGIGTNNPQSYIHINSNSSNDWISFRIDRNNSPQWTFGNSSNNSFYIDSQQGGGRVLTLTPSGNVGIGTTNPQSKLHIYSTYSWDALTIESGSSAGINIKSRNNNGAGFIYFTNLNNGNLWNIFHNNQDQNLSFYFYNSSSRNWTHALTLANNGNVGIGTTNPGAKLHVIGSAIIQGSQRVYSSDGSRLLFEITEE